MITIPKNFGGGQISIPSGAGEGIIAQVNADGIVSGGPFDGFSMEDIPGATLNPGWFGAPVNPSSGPSTFKVSEGDGRFTQELMPGYVETAQPDPSTVNPVRTPGGQWIDGNIGQALSVSDRWMNMGDPKAQYAAWHDPAQKDAIVNQLQSYGEAHPLSHGNAFMDTYAPLIVGGLATMGGLSAAGGLSGLASGSAPAAASTSLAPAATAGTGLAALPASVNPVLAAAGKSALLGGVSSALRGQNPIVGAALGGLTGGATSAISPLVSNLTPYPIVNNAIGSAGVGAVATGLGGGNPITGALMSGASSGLGGAIDYALGPSNKQIPGAKSLSEVAGGNMPQTNGLDEFTTEWASQFPGGLNEDGSPNWDAITAGMAAVDEGNAMPDYAPSSTADNSWMTAGQTASLPSLNDSGWQTTGQTARDMTPVVSTVLGKLLSGQTLTNDDLGKLLGNVGSTALGVVGGLDQSNAIRDANDKNAAALAAAQSRAMASLTEAQKQALQSSGAGRDEAIKAYNAALAQATQYNEQALKAGTAGFESGRNAAVDASTAALNRGLGYNESALSKSLGTLQDSTNSALATSNAARDVSLGALEDAKNKALSTLTDSQRAALQTSGAGRDAAIAAYQDALKTALATSAQAKNEGMGILQAAQAGALGSNQATEGRYFDIGAPARARLESSYQPGFSMSNEPGYKDAIDQVMQSYLRKASTGGNPFENPGVSMEANKYVTDSTALPQLNTYRTQLNQFGGQGLDTAGNAALQRPGIYSSLGSLQSNLASDFGKFDASLNTSAGQGIAGVNQQTAQNDANLISQTGKSGADIYSNLGALQSGVSSDFGKFNAGLTTAAGNRSADLTSNAGQFGTGLIDSTGRAIANYENTAGTNIGNANLNAGQFNTDLINKAGVNSANAGLTTGQNDSNLIGNLGKAGAQVQAETYNTTPTSNSGVYNALGSGLANLTNPGQDYSAVLNQILKQYQLMNARVA